MKEDTKIGFIIIGIVLIMVCLILSIGHAIVVENKLKAIQSTQDSMQISIYSNTDELVQLGSKLRTQQDNTETIMKWNELQAKRINKLYKRSDKIEKIAKGALELGLRSKESVGWGNLYDGNTKRFLPASPAYKKSKRLILIPESKGSK